jgi:hypothetical protein
VDQGVVLNLLRGSIVSKGAWVRDPGLKCGAEMTYMGIRNWGSRDQDLGTGVFNLLFPVSHSMISSRGCLLYVLALFTLLHHSNHSNLYIPGPSRT